MCVFVAPNAIHTALFKNEMSISNGGNFTVAINRLFSPSFVRMVTGNMNMAKVKQHFNIYFCMKK